MGSFNTENTSVLYNVRLAGDAKHYPEKGDKGAITYLFCYYGTKGGEDLPCDVHVKRGAALAANYKKGDIVTIQGALHFKLNNQGKLTAVLYADKVVSQVKLKDRAGEAPVDSIPEMPADTAVEGEAPAFE